MKFSDSYEAPKRNVPPTFLQYLKTCNKSVEGKTRFGVEIVWLPGKFDNVTLQTHAFRYIADNDHPLYDEVQEYLKSEGGNATSKRLDITILSMEDSTISLSESSRKTGTWKRLGNNGYKFDEP